MTLPSIIKQLFLCIKANLSDASGKKILCGQFSCCLSEEHLRTYKTNIIQVNFQVPVILSTKL